MNRTNVVSLFDLKQKKLKIDEDKMYNDIFFDTYIPYNEVGYWSELTNFGITYSKEMYKTTENKVYKQFEEVLGLHSVDIDMYKDFGYTLDKFRFMFSYFETYTLFKMVEKYKEQASVYKKENEQYFNQLQMMVKKDKKMYEHIELLMRQ